jgi:sulfatase maturation enzyme AslB (radical SAM superfamily)
MRRHNDGNPLQFERPTMNPAVIAKSARNLLSAVEIKVNRRLGREFVPAPRDMLFIETSSLCNLKCRFCAYEKKHSPKVSMKDDFFADCVGQALDMGYRQFELTPCTGDVFMDRHIFRKLEFLENNPGVQGYQFFTNFSIPKHADIERLVALKKLKHLAVSIYGHDRASFIAITQSTGKVYDRLISNLDLLFKNLGRKTFDLEFGFHTARAAPPAAGSEIMQRLARFERAGIPVRRSRVYNNWGGMISNEDVKGLGIDITGTDAMYKNGACSLLFTTVQVMANGIVNGCGCRDVDATLRIGDLKVAPLRYIISARNATYMGLIEEQQRGDFRPICRGCDFYKSIYHVRARHRKEGHQFQSIAEFKASLDAPATGRA